MTLSKPYLSIPLPLPCHANYDWGTVVAVLRFEADLSQARLAKLSGVTQGHISRFEKREYEPRATDLAKLTAVFDATFDAVPKTAEVIAARGMAVRTVNLTAMGEAAQLAARTWTPEGDAPYAERRRRACAHVVHCFPIRPELVASVMDARRRA